MSIMDKKLSIFKNIVLQYLDRNINHAEFKTTSKELKNNLEFILQYIDSMYDMTYSASLDFLNDSVIINEDVIYHSIKTSGYTITSGMVFSIIQPMNKELNKVTNLIFLLRIDNKCVYIGRELSNIFKGLMWYVNTQHIAYEEELKYNSNYKSILFIPKTDL